MRRATATGNNLAAAAAAAAAAARGGDDAAVPAAAPWFSALTEALRSGRLSREQYHAIRSGLGDPPTDHHHAGPDTAVQVWRTAAAVLLEEAEDQSVEDLRGSARLARDTLDPVGAQLRFDERFERRSFRMWLDEDGVYNGRFRCDDDGAAWIRTILSAALRPRRGPRFVTPEESEGDHRSRVTDGRRAGEDTRSNEQLQYDTLISVLKSGHRLTPTPRSGTGNPVCAC